MTILHPRKWQVDYTWEAVAPTPELDVTLRLAGGAQLSFKSVGTDFATQLLQAVAVKRPGVMRLGGMEIPFSEIKDVRVELQAA